MYFFFNFFFKKKPFFFLKFFNFFFFFSISVFLLQRVLVQPTRAGCLLSCSWSLKTVSVTFNRKASRLFFFANFMFSTMFLNVYSPLEHKQGLHFLSSKESYGEAGRLELRCCEKLKWAQCEARDLTEGRRGWTSMSHSLVPIRSRSGSSVAGTGPGPPHATRGNRSRRRNQTLLTSQWTLNFARRCCASVTVVHWGPVNRRHRVGWLSPAWGQRSELNESRVWSRWLQVNNANVNWYLQCAALC